MSRRPPSKPEDMIGKAEKIEAVPSSPRLARGQCPKCLVRYGRAMVSHVQVCNGKPEWPGIGPKPTEMIQNGQPVGRAAA